MSPVDASFDTYRLGEEHTMLRESVRQLADDKIAPRAAETDETGEFPWDVYEALRKADLLAVHIPEEYGGAGADSHRDRDRHRGGRPGLRRRPR